MYYADIQKRTFVRNVNQYRHFRIENKKMVDFFKRFPKLPSDFDIQFHQRWDFGSFTLNKISYYVEPYIRVKSYLLIPKEKCKRRPGLLALHQHNDEYHAGKSETVGLVKNPEYTKLRAVEPQISHRTPECKKQYGYAKDLCEMGFVVLAPDFFGFEEYRDLDWNLRDYYDEPGFLRGYEEMLSEKLLLHGSSLMIKHIHDLYVAVSVLSSIKEVNPERIGVIGHSQGGEFASLLTAFDRRVFVGVSSCGFVCYEDFMNSNRMETASTIIPGFCEIKRDFDYFLDMIPPTPFLSTMGTKEGFVEGKKLLQKSRENFRAEVFVGGHSFPDTVRAKAYSFIKQYLY